MNRVWIVSTAALVALLVSSSIVLADRDEHEYAERERGFFSRLFGRSHPDTGTPESPFYREECGSCHFAYQPGLLPAESWEKIMSGLENHFGENAELPAESRQAIRDYLLSNAGRGEPALRITETRFFRHEHDEIPLRFVRDNPQVKSFANCERCHADAERGSYNEHQVVIPGVGRWDD